MSVHRPPLLVVIWLIFGTYGTLSIFSWYSIDKPVYIVHQKTLRSAVSTSKRTFWVLECQRRYIADYSLMGSQHLSIPYSKVSRLTKPSVSSGNHVGNHRDHGTEVGQRRETNQQQSIHLHDDGNYRVPTDGACNNLFKNFPSL